MCPVLTAHAPPACPSQGSRKSSLVNAHSHRSLSNSSPHSGRSTTATGTAFSPAAFNFDAKGGATKAAGASALTSAASSSSSSAAASMSDTEALLAQLIGLPSGLDALERAIEIEYEGVASPSDADFDELSEMMADLDFAEKHAGAKAS